MAEYILETKSLSYKYTGSNFALNNITVQIETGKKTVFLGGNGAGKTTLFLHFNGILRPSSGRVIFKGKEVTYSHSFLKDLRKSVGIVFQDPETQLFSASVCQEVSFGPLNLGMPKEKVMKYVNYALAATGTTMLKDKPTQFLSYGEKKKVTIASILSMMPEVIIFDEPNNYLDPKHRVQIIEFLTSLNKSGTTIILSTHDIDLAYAWADQIIVMDQGTILKEADPFVIFQDNDLINKANLAIPWVLEFYRELKKQGYIPDDTPLPRSKPELFDLLAKHK
jgi:cobalt/nickel transport system ATP-binding protein